ncbi:MAG: DUF1684 domain-containing protein [Myxococcaceae bacterium]
MLWKFAAFMLATLPQTAAADFASEWRAWHEERVGALKAPRGWLSLTGIHWLSPGENRNEGLPGVFGLADGQVTVTAAAGDGYVLDGKPVTRHVLISDAKGKPDLVKLGKSQTLALIARGPKLALRVWDENSPGRKGFKGIEAFPPDPSWRITARWEPYPTPRPVQVPSVVGIPTQELAPGRAWFVVQGKEYSLEPTTDGDGLFFVFKDQTSREQTYGSGRFLDAPAPRDGKLVLDFNRAVNPPCAFTRYATCPLPRPENVLPVRIEAGEKRPAGH